MTDLDRARAIAGSDADLYAKILNALTAARDNEREKCQLLLSLIEWDIAEEFEDFDCEEDLLQ